MHPYVLIPLLSGVVAAMLATAVWVMGPRHRAHRLVAAILGCAAYWSLLEVVWNSLDAPTWVPWLIRFSSLGWMPLGVLSIHLFLELIGDTTSRWRRLLPALYAAAGVSSLLYIATPWGIASVLPTSWGWSFREGPLFLLLYLPVAGLATVSLAVLWRRLYPAHAPASERREGYVAFAAIAIPLVTASLTDALLPMLDIHVPRLGSASMTLIGATVAWSMHHYGYSVLAPATFAPEILATLRDGVALLRQDGVIRSANASLARLCECAPEHLVARSIGEFWPLFESHAEREVQDRECEFLTLSRRPLAVSVSTSFLRNRQGERAGLVLSVRDLREVKALRGRLMMSGRLAAVGELAAGIAHEINNPAAFIQANLVQLGRHWKLLRDRLGQEPPPEDPELREALDEGSELIQESLGGVSRISAIVKDVRGFAHQGEREAADLNRLMDSTLRIAEPQLRYKAEIEKLYGPIPTVRCNPQEIQQVFLNLLMNAAHAIPERGTIRILTELESGFVVVAIEDDGCGMTPQVRERIFDPFFTTRKAGEGMGLGLSLAYQIVTRYGGDIQVETEPGEGSCLRIRLPATPATASESP